ncbi:hypothetical protein [Nocardia huaxiensis]|uniref:Uncharacterized protein n=1 Tax=Nocardia huaxiensis TaxID=2755382 RepID=A0A7D6Z455_9NOCA|nr:hypothetical protein [Nocardia huaxiensis]QLY32346.1 hypothetical protein H0264_08865 [Nocardia huaxiensis]UFS93946.1 hypothetical protein LPY97_24555 [Nocardia huaxiensis]
MPAHRRAFAALLCGIAVSGATAGAAAAEPAKDALGGCFRADTLTGQMVAGTGSAGQTVRRQLGLWECRSSLLPGIDSAQFSAEVPWLSFGTLSSGRFAWSDGSVSAAVGHPNGLWTLTSGPGSGHTIVLNTDPVSTGDWYYTSGSRPVSSATFLE